MPADHEFCSPAVERDVSAEGTASCHERGHTSAGGDDTASHRGADLPAGLTLAERVEYAAAAFESMGWEEFARLAVFVGHASQTSNDPFTSSLDCGACAGNPGGPSARVLATVCNDAAVRERLGERGIDVPPDTVFVAGEHNTTTDEVTLYADDVPGSHEDDLKRLRAALEAVRAGAAVERAESMDSPSERGGRDGVRETERRPTGRRPAPSGVWRATRRSSSARGPSPPT